MAACFGVALTLMVASLEQREGQAVDLGGKAVEDGAGPHHATGSGRMSNRRLRRQKWVRWSILSAVAIAVMLVLLHVAGIMVLDRMGERLLHPAPEKGFDPGAVDLNLFSGRLEMRGASLQRDGAPWLKIGRLDFDLDTLALLSGEIRIASIDVEDVWLRVEQTADGGWLLPLALPAGTAAADTDDDEALPIGIGRVHLGKLTLHYVKPGVKEDLVLEALDAGPYDMALAEQQVPVNLSLSLAGGSLGFDGDLTLASTVGVEGKVRLKDTDLSRLARLLDPGMELAGRPRVTADISAAADAFRFQGAVAVSGLAVEQAGNALAIGKLDLPALKMAWSGKDQSLSIAMAKGLATEKLVVATPDARASLAQAGLAGTMAVGLQLAADATPLSRLSVAGDLALKTLELTLPAVDGQQLAAAALEIDALQMNGLEQIELGKLELRTLSIAQQVGQPLKLASLHLDKTRLQGQHLDIEAIELDGLSAALHKAADTGLRLPVELPATPAPGAEAASEATAEKSPFTWRLGQMRLKGENRIHFTDTSVEPAREKTLEIETLELGALDSRSPETDTPLKLRVRPDAYSELDLSGDIRPLAEQPHIRLEGQLSGFDLAWVSPYAEPAMGHRILEGELDDQFNLRLEGSQLDMANKIQVHKIAVEALPPKEGQQTLPLKLGISLLQDRQGRIKLDVPVKGDVNDPEFKVLGALNPIILKAITGAAALAVQPVGSVLLVGSVLAGDVLAVKFKSVRFEAASAQPLAGSDAYLDQLAEKLTQRPGLKLRLCGVATAVDLPKPATAVDPETGKPLAQTVDRQAQEQTALALAKARSKHVRMALVQRGVDESRLLSCRPRLETKADVEPQVEIGL